MDKPYFIIYPISHIIYDLQLNKYNNEFIKKFVDFLYTIENDLCKITIKRLQTKDELILLKFMLDIYYKFTTSYYSELLQFIRDLHILSIYDKDKIYTKIKNHYNYDKIGIKWYSSPFNFISYFIVSKIMYYTNFNKINSLLLTNQLNLTNNEYQLLNDIYNFIISNPLIKEELGFNIIPIKYNHNNIFYDIEWIDPNNKLKYLENIILTNN